jgi:GH25 family lysozyme M1 (1,4-beta-N-acetylmuramidase)
MSIRFAPAVRHCASRLTPRQVRARQVLAANDNTLRQVRADALHAALRHFARHGMAAARIAGEQAAAALAANDPAGHALWLDICKTLDRRTAAQVASLAAKQRHGHQAR